MINKKEIYLAGGCFWGTEKYLSSIYGVIETEVGYANGTTENPTYEEVCHNNTGHAETVHVIYDENKITLSKLLDIFYESIDPTSINRQGGDTGFQYRTGIYYVDSEDKAALQSSIQVLQTQYNKPIAIEVKELENYYSAENYHQKYLEKNPNGYCHIPNLLFEKAKLSNVSLTDIQYEVTQNAATEPPFQNEFFDHFEPGIYVDIVTGEPLFLSTDKFESGCGWPSFSKPLDQRLVKELEDLSHGMKRVEVRSKRGNSHLGHVFTDGPKELGGIRYCINSASLRFIPKDAMMESGFGYLLPLVEEK